MRPHRNPDNSTEIDANARWLLDQINSRAVMDPDWVWHPEALLDHPGSYIHYQAIGTPGTEGIMVRYIPWQFRRFDPETERDLREQHRVVEIGDLARRERDAGRARARETGMEYAKKYPRWTMDKFPKGTPILRDISLPPFKVPYDSHEQINTKLNNTVVMIKDVPYYVNRTMEVEPGKFGLLLSEGRHASKFFWVAYDDMEDFRGIAPGYVNRQGEAYWLYRAPDRQNSQGMNARNMHIKPAGRDDGYINGASIDFLMETLAKRDDMQYSPYLHQMFEARAISSVRLNNNIALYLTKKKGALIGVEYCGRSLGLIVRDGVKLTNPADARPSWIRKDLASVGLTVGD